MATTEQVAMVTFARLQVEKLQRKLEQAEEARRAAEREIDATEAALAEARQELLKAEAARDSNFYPVGTRVRHHLWGHLTGTVVESDGTGVAIRQDGQTDASYGFTSREWVRL